MRMLAGRNHRATTSAGGLMISRLLVLAALVGTATLLPSAAYAQDDGLLIAPVLPPDYDRGRNISVTERPRPDYEALGIRRGGFLIYPQVELGLGVSDNIYLSEVSGTSAGYARFAPSVRVASDWSRHQLGLTANGDFRRYFGQPRRNEDNWRVAGLGRLDIGDAYSVTGEIQGGQAFETPFSGEVNSTVAALSSYTYSTFSARGQYSPGRTRFVLAVNRNRFDFSRIDLGNGTILDQSDRNRTIVSTAGQAQYALSPSASVYGQLSYARTDYDTALAPGVPNRTSNGYRLLAGLSVDLPAFLRGTLGIGYTVRDYISPAYRDVQGLSVEGKLEYFLSELTTLTFRLQRTIEDSQLANTNAYFDNRVSLRADHELLRNLILNASAEYAHQNYIDTDRSNDVFRLGTGGRYLLSNALALGLNGSYAYRNRDGTGYNGTLHETRGEVSIIFQR